LYIYLYTQNIIQRVFVCFPGVQASELEPLVGGVGTDMIDGLENSLQVRLSAGYVTLFT